jgi:hypothetical protein
VVPAPTSGVAVIARDGLQDLIRARPELQAHANTCPTTPHVEHISTSPTTNTKTANAIPLRLLAKAPRSSFPHLPT